MAAKSRTSARPNASAQPRVGIVTVSYGSGNVLDTFLDSVKTHCAKDVVVAVVDNKPGLDGVEEITAQHDALYVPLPSNPGYGAGMNAGATALVKAAGATETEEAFDAFFICNPDVQFTENSVQPLLQVLLGDDSIGAVGPMLLNDDGTTYPSAREIPSVSNGIGHAAFGVIWPNNPWTRRYKNAATHTVQRNAGWLSGAAVMVKASVWNEIGGFDEGYFLNFEDIDLGFRIGKAGYRNVFVPSTSVVHSGAHSTSQHAELSERAMHESAVRFMRKRYAGVLRAPIRWMVVLGLKLRGALILRSIRRNAAS